MASRYAVSASLLPALSCSMRAWILAEITSCAVVFFSAGLSFVAAHALLQVAFWALPALESRARIAIKNNMLS